MQTTSTYETQQKRGGGRVASAAYRQSLECSEDFDGLEENTNRYDLLLLVKRAGKAAGFSPRMIVLLDYYMAFTRDVDWEEGGRPIVYQSLARTALDLGVSERQIQNLEKQLFDAGAITWNDSGNHRRFGQRDANSGKIIYAYGVDLTPLAFLKTKLEDKLHEKQLYDEAWMETKRQISWYRGQLCALLSECEANSGREEGALVEFVARYEKIAVKIRTYISLEELRTLLERHKSLHSELSKFVGVGTTKPVQRTQRTAIRKRTPIHSSQGAENFVHKESTTQRLFDKSNTEKKGMRESVPESSRRQTGNRENERLGNLRQPNHLTGNDLVLATGLQHITLKQTLQASSDRFREYLPIDSRPLSWADVTEAAYRLRSRLRISQSSWSEACELLGRNGAAVCVVLTDQAMHRAEDPVTKPAGYFRAMVNRAGGGRLRLHASILGLIKRAG